MTVTVAEHTQGSHQSPPGRIEAVALPLLARQFDKVGFAVAGR